MMSTGDGPKKLDFARETYLAIRRVAEHPDAWSPLSANTRRCLTNRFPYGIVYRIEGEHIFVIAVMHLSRKPGYYRRRVR